MSKKNFSTLFNEYEHILTLYINGIKSSNIEKKVAESIQDITNYIYAYIHKIIQTPPDKGVENKLSIIIKKIAYEKDISVYEMTGEIKDIITNTIYDILFSKEKKYSRKSPTSSIIHYLKQKSFYTLLSTYEKELKAYEAFKESQAEYADDEEISLSKEVIKKHLKSKQIDLYLPQKEFENLLNTLIQLLEGRLKIKDIPKQYIPIVEHLKS
jgi:hypothetical protein